MIFEFPIEGPPSEILALLKKSTVKISSHLQVVGQKPPDNWITLQEHYTNCGKEPAPDTYPTYLQNTSVHEVYSVDLANSAGRKGNTLSNKDLIAGAVAAVGFLLPAVLPSGCRPDVLHR